MNDLTVKNVDLFGDTVIAAQDKDGVIWAGISWICNGIGLNKDQTGYERKKIQGDLVLSQGVKFYPLGTDNANSDVLCLQLDYVPLWLSKISITPNMKENNPELVDKLVKYQLKAKDVLAKAFLYQKEERKERLETVNETVKIFTDLMQRAGCSAEIQLLTVKTIIENNTGMVLPIMIQADKKYYDTEYIARKVGMYVKSSGKPAEKAVNEIIRRLDISEDMYTETWETNGKWQGTVRKYTDDVIKMVLNWCDENGYPNDIEYIQSDGQKKKYHVKWREVA